MWGSSFLAAIPPDSVLASLRPSVPPSLPPSFCYTHNQQSSCDHLTHTQLVISSSHTHTLILSSHISHSHTQSSHHLTHTLILSSYHPVHMYIPPPSHTYSSTSSSSPLPLISSQQITILILFTFPTHIISTFRVAGAVSRASRRGCGARCHRWCRLLSSWQAQYPEPPEGAAARVVAAGAACCLPRGRRSTQSL